MLTMLIALAFGWYSSSQRAGRRVTHLSKRLYHQKMIAQQAEYLKDVDGLADSNRRAENKDVFSSVKFDRINMRGISVNGKFQLVTFDQCVLRDVSLVGGQGSFQSAHFNNCDLTNAKLRGGSGAFQMSSFVGSDLTGAILTGASGSFQGASFQDSTLVDAKIQCSGVERFRWLILTGFNFRVQTYLQSIRLI